MQTVILIIHVLLAVALIVLILVQHGKGADAGAAFGSGASSTVFGARGSATFLTKLTTVIALIFFVTSISLAYIASNKTSESKSLIENNQRDIKTPSNTPDKDLP
ncbi:MAG: preprotein translocase subunit SecG [Pseudomonadota bacterium]|nr:preprotein translocase subunit SecG [Pseudomonadota bacterium]